VDQQQAVREIFIAPKGAHTLITDPLSQLWSMQPIHKDWSV